jgi:hypothetical protein
MEDFKDLVSSLTVTGFSLMRSPVARRQLAKMVYFQTTRAVGRPAFRQALIRYLIRLTLVYIAGKYFVYRLFLHPANQLPGPPPDLLVPFLGNFRQLLSKDVSYYQVNFVKSPVLTNHRFFLLGGGHSS